mgnify:CR=1 FL=1
MDILGIIKKYMRKKPVGPRCIFCKIDLSMRFHGSQFGFFERPKRIGTGYICLTCIRELANALAPAIKV